MVSVEFTHEAARQFAALLRPVQREFDEVFLWLERNPLHLPPWVQCKQIGEARGRKVSRLRVGGHRGIFTFDGAEVVFTRFRDRPNLKYGAMPKT